MARIWKYTLIISFIILADQLTKGIVQSKMSFGESIPVIDGFFSFTYVKNPGAAFGLGADAESWVRKLLFLFLPVIACMWLATLIWKTRNKQLLLGLAYSLILAGAIGNLIDRFSYGYVVDFLDFYFNVHHFPAFNVADSSITIAAGLLILDFLFELKRNKEIKGANSKEQLKS